MIIETLSTFPDMYASVMGASMMRIAQEKGILEFHAHDLRDWTHDRHRTTDDEPYGGGDGLVMKCAPIFEAYEDICRRASKPYTIFLAPQGRRFDDAAACELAKQDHLLFICGHYEGIDERAYTLADQVISLGDYVLTSGELASMVVIDAVVEYPQYTRPANFNGMEVPPVLLSGNHGAVDVWRRQQSLERTWRLRPDLLEGVTLTDADRAFLQTLSTADGR